MRAENEPPLVELRHFGDFKLILSDYGYSQGYDHQTMTIIFMTWYDSHFPIMLDILCQPGRA